MMQNRKDRQRPESVNNGSMTKGFGRPRQKAVSRLLETLLEQCWLTGGPEVRLDLISCM